MMAPLGVLYAAKHKIRHAANSRMMETVIVAGNLKKMINENEGQQNIMTLKPRYE